MQDHRCFVQHFLLCLGISAGAFYAWWVGYPQDVWKTDLSYMTTVIAALVIFAMFDIGHKCWSVRHDSHPHFILYLIGCFPLLGLLGTSTGLRMNIATLAAGDSGMLPLATAVETMQVGIGALILVGLMVFNLEDGIRRAETELRSSGEVA